MNTNLYTQNQNVIIMKVLGACEILKISTIWNPLQQAFPFWATRKGKTSPSFGHHKVEEQIELQ
jgi:hypothetical protein